MQTSWGSGAVREADYSFSVHSLCGRSRGKLLSVSSYQDLQFVSGIYLVVGVELSFVGAKVPSQM
jgi:hypothetical protein